MKLLTASLAERLGQVTAVQADRVELDDALGRDYVRRRANLEPESAVDRALRRAGVATCRSGVPVLRAEPAGMKACIRDRGSAARCEELLPAVSGPFVTASPSRPARCVGARR